ncbi:unnamed protein product [Arctogadus glacialis]
MACDWPKPSVDQRQPQRLIGERTSILQDSRGDCCTKMAAELGWKRWQVELGSPGWVGEGLRGCPSRPRDSFVPPALWSPLPEHGQKFPGLGPADTAGLDGAEQERAEAGPGGSGAQAGATEYSPELLKNVRQLYESRFPKTSGWLAARRPEGLPVAIHLLAELLSYSHLSGRRLPQWHHQTYRKHLWQQRSSWCPCPSTKPGNTAATHRTE